MPPKIDDDYTSVSKLIKYFELKISNQVNNGSVRFLGTSRHVSSVGNPVQPGQETDPGIALKPALKKKRGGKGPGRKVRFADTSIVHELNCTAADVFARKKFLSIKRRI